MRMKTQTLWICVLLAASLACGPGVPKTKRLDREILGAELKFGRDAANFELWNEAIFRWEKVVKLDPANHEAVNNLAVAYESVGDYDRARDLYRKALELDEDNRSIRQNYKRFLNFYKKHQRQLKREQERKSRAQGDGAQGDDQDASDQDEDDQAGEEGS